MNSDRLHVSVTVDAKVTDTVNGDLLSQAVRACLETVQATGEASFLSLGQMIEVSVLVTDDGEIQRLNKEYRELDRPTDILSFSLVTDDEGRLTSLPGTEMLALGDVVLSYPYAVRQAATLGHSIDIELSWLLIHGTLQLIGYTHDTDESAERMEALEREALGTMGYSVP